MLKFTSLTIENFGPYKGIQTIDFTDKDGVTIIVGDNGRGKTTILNIFRYALFGYYRDRRGRDVDLMTLVNDEGKEEGNWNAKVTLKMENDGTHYDLIREYTVREGVTEPKSDDDYVKDLFLIENGDILGADKRDHVLNSIMPSEVSRFFLFDGELLQQYEELLDEETESNTAIKDSIEKILGVPILTNGALDTDAVLTSYNKEKNRIAKDDEKTQKIVSQIEDLEAQITKHDDQIKKLNDDLEEYRSEYNMLQNDVDTNEHVRTQIDRMEALDKSIAEKRERREKVISQISEQTKDAWKGLASDRINKVLDDLEAQIDVLKEKETAHTVEKRTLEEMERSIKQHRCEICGQDIDDAHVNELVVKLAEYTKGTAGLTEEESKELQRLNTRKMTLEDMVSPSKTEILSALEDELDELDIQIPAEEGDRKTILTDLEHHGDVEELTKDAKHTTVEMAHCLQKIDSTNKGIDDEKRALQETKSARVSLEEKLSVLSTNEEVAAAEKKVELCRKINDIFEKGIDIYRNKLKSDVERDASELFVSIRTEPDYVKLKINDNYGLEIVNKSGNIVPLRSSGYEHIVALSLIGALHKNAPLQGPIIMDSTFFRLSPEHRSNAIKALLKMSDQIVLLVMPGEIDEQETRRILGSSLLGEYHLVRRSSRYTEIERQ